MLIIFRWSWQSSFSERPQSKCFQLHRPRGLQSSYSTLLLWSKSSHRLHKSKWARCVSIKLYLHKQPEGRIWTAGHSWPTPGSLDPAPHSLNWHTASTSALSAQQKGQETFTYKFSPNNLGVTWSEPKIRVLVQSPEERTPTLGGKKKALPY